jgi:uncharacterized repeat protein (TIGR01451 family)
MERSKQMKWGRCGQRLCSTLIVILAQQILCCSLASASGTITGTVFQDFNSDGVFNTTSSGSLPAVDVHLAGVTVSAYDSDGALQGTTTTVRCTGVTAPSAFCTGADTGPNYSLSVGGTGPYRIEFTDFPSSFHSTFVGTNNDSSVQFVPDGNSNTIDFGLNSPSDYCQADPRLATSCFVEGNQITGPNKDNPVVVSFPYSASGQDPSVEIGEALAKQVGSTWGLAYHRTSRSLFVAAYVKRGAGLGPGSGNGTSDGTGTIYRITPGNPADGTVFLDFDDLFGSSTTGVDPHTDFNPDPPDFDAGAFDAIGKVALGDIDISEDDATLYAINLADRKLYVLPIGLTPTAPTAGQVTSSSVPNPGCVNGVARPFGVKVRRGLVYVGGVCTAENGGTASNLSAYVYSFDPTASTWSSSPVLEFPLNYPRGCADLGGTYGQPCYPPSATTGSLADWRPWRSTLDTSFPAGKHVASEGIYTSHPQPMLTDIEFVGDTMVVGLRDRFAEQIGANDPGPDGSGVSGANVWSIPAGDILRAGADGVGGWTIEDNAQSVPAGSFGPSAGANNHQGPGEGEFYYGDDTNFGPDAAHDEDSLGGLVQVPGFPEIVLTVMDPAALFSAGVYQLNNTSGARTNSYEVYVAHTNFEKSNGLGDLEALCEPAPLEIGNRVWTDTNGNGRQDPNETGIDGVTVQLYRNGTLVGTTTTATVNGQAGSYYFHASNVTLNGASGIEPGTGTVGGNSQYEVRIPNISGGSKQGTLGALVLTTADVNTGNDSDIRDSDGAVSGVNAVYVIPYADLAGPGFVNHTYDFGFTTAPPVLSSLSGCVYVDANSNGVMDSTEHGIGGVTITLTCTDAINNDMATIVTTTASDGTYSATNLLPGTCTVTETQPSGYTDGQDSLGSAGGTLGNDVISSVTLPAGVDATGYCFGETGSSDLCLENPRFPAAAQVGQTVTYRLSVVNYGPEDATNVTFTDQLPAGVTFVAAKPGQGSCSGVTTLTCNLGTIPNGATVFIFVTVKVVQEGALTVTASLTSSKPDPNTGNNTAVQIARGVSVGDVRVKVRLFNSRSEEVTDLTLCLSPFDFGFVVLQHGSVTPGQYDELTSRFAKARFLSVTDDFLPEQGYVTLVATDVFRSTDGSCVDLQASLPSDTPWPLATWAVLQDVGSGFFATDVPTLSVQVDPESGAVLQGKGLIPGGNSTIVRFDANPNVTSQTNVFVWLAENASDPNGTNRPGQLTAFLECEDELEISTTLTLPDEVNIIDPNTLPGIGQCKQLQQYRGILRFELPVPGFVWSHVSQAGQQYRSSFLGYNLECNSFLPSSDDSCKFTGYLMGDPAAGKLVPYYKITPSLATIIGVENLIGNAGPDGPQ